VEAERAPVHATVRAERRRKRDEGTAEHVRMLTKNGTPFRMS
jgi:hypothetical protein